MPQTLAPTPSLPVNDLAAAYQPRRVVASIVSIGWNLALAGALVFGGGAWAIYRALAKYAALRHLPAGATTPAYLAVLFSLHAAANYPVELWFGYLEERQFGLAKDGVRSWTRDWLVGVARHGMMFVAGSSLLLFVQSLTPRYWVVVMAVVLLALFLSTAYFYVDLLPRGLFQVEPIDAASLSRLRNLLPGATPAFEPSLPPVIVFSAPNLRDFSGGMVGLGDRRALMLSRSTLAAASDPVLRFVLLHELGHRHFHHLLLATLSGWAWVAGGLCASDGLIVRWSPESVGHPPYVAWLAMLFSAWMAAGEPILAYLGRRVEYQADRYYLRHGGTTDEMRAALEELSNRNLARTEGLRLRHTMFHPLPSVWNRLHAARRYVESLHPERP